MLKALRFGAQDLREDSNYPTIYFYYEPRDEETTLLFRCDGTDAEQETCIVAENHGMHKFY